MRAAARLLMAALLVLPSVGAPAMAGGETDRAFTLAPFTSVATTDRIDVNIVKGDSFSVVLHADRSVIDRIRVEVAGGALSVGLPSNMLPRARWYAAGAVVEIAMPTLASLDIGGGSRGTVSLGMPDQPVRVRLSEGSILTGTLVCRTLDFAASSGDADLAGRAQDFRLVATGRFEGDFSSFEVPRAAVELSEASTAIVNVTQELSVIASSGSGLRYRGSPTITSQVLSGGAWLKPQTGQ